MNSIVLVDFFRHEYFLPDLKAETKEAVLEELIRPLVDEGKIKTKDIVLETLAKRETLGSTGIGKGVAIPHCRTLAISEVQIVVGVSKRGIPYDAIDRKKVHLFFLIIAPPQEESNLYLPILGKVVEMLRDSKVRKLLMKAKDFRLFLDIIEGV